MINMSSIHFFTNSLGTNLISAYIENYIVLHMGGLEFWTSKYRANAQLTAKLFTLPILPKGSMLLSCLRV